MASFFGPPREITLGGRVYLAAHMKLKAWAIVQQWIKDNVPGPLAVLEDPSVERMGAAARRELAKQAFAEAREFPPRVGSPSWYTAIARPGGPAAFLLAALGPHNPGFGPEEAERAEAAMELSSVDELASLALVVMGRELPKAEGPAAPPGPARRDPVEPLSPAFNHPSPSPPPSNTTRN